MQKSKNTTEYRIEDLLFAFQKKIFKAIRDEVKSLNCSIPQGELIKHLSEHESMSLSDIARHLGITKPSASVMIDGMENRGLVRRETPKEDRRSTLITLTPKSQALVKKIAAKKKNVIGVLMKKMNKKEQSELSTLLTKLLID